MKPITVFVAAALLSVGAFAQSRGEANYEEQCKRAPAQGTAAEQAATRARCIEDAKKAAKSDVPGADPSANAAGTRGAATPAEKEAARAERKAAGAQAAKEPKQDPKRPTAN